MKSMADNSIDCIVTDPPYGLNFMGKDWDHGIPGPHFWTEALRICKPGAHLLAFGGTRTYHRLTCAIEDAGWEIRDCLCWLYGSGFPKSHNHFGFPGYGTALKPAYEPIIMAMKPLEGTYAQNAEKWGVAGINIDSCRIGIDDTRSKSSMTALGQNSGWNSHQNKEVIAGSACGRWPANLLLDEESASMLDQQSGIEASRFFYCAKASSSERNAGLEGMPFNERETSSGNNRTRFCTDCKLTDNGQNDHSQCNGEMVNSVAKPSRNNHPTVKPLALMQYLIKLVMPPNPEAILLDPFAGSGTIILAAKQLNRNAKGIEISEEYAEIARKRLESCKVPIEQFELGL